MFVYEFFMQYNILLQKIFVNVKKEISWNVLAGPSKFPVHALVSKRGKQYFELFQINFQPKNW